ncbi:hypothetical protein Bbelb_011190 [Branchiostoma belcheri]|nr:hypothetical protein Bbelb_011190 [Branchiostoma belcheri]
MGSDEEVNPSNTTDWLLSAKKDEIQPYSDHYEFSTRAFTEMDIYYMNSTKEKLINIYRTGNKVVGDEGRRQDLQTEDILVNAQDLQENLSEGKILDEYFPSMQKFTSTLQNSSSPFPVKKSVVQMGEAVIQHWKLWFVLFLGTKRSQCVCEAANLLALTSRRTGLPTTWHTFRHTTGVSTSGGKAKPVEMLGEHYNRVIKTTCHSFGGRLQFKHAQNISLAVHSKSSMRRNILQTACTVVPDHAATPHQPQYIKAIVSIILCGDHDQISKGCPHNICGKCKGLECKDKRHRALLKQLRQIQSTPDSE